MSNPGEKATFQVYLDTCVYNRPFDDQMQPRIWLETLAFSVIMQLIEDRSIALVTSSLVAYEGSLNPNLLGRVWVERCMGLAAQHQLVDETIRERAKALEQ